MSGHSTKGIGRETVQCNLEDAHRGQLNRGVTRGDCEETLVHGRLSLRRGSLRLRGVGDVWARVHDRERLRGVHALLEVRVAKTVRDDPSPGASVSIEKVDLHTVAIDRRGEGARASVASTEDCVLCELLVGQAQTQPAADEEHVLSSL